MADTKQVKKSKWSEWMDKLGKPYRLVIINDESFEEVQTTKLSLLNLYTIASSIFIAGIILVFLLIIFTPLKRYIPGLGNFEAEEKAKELENRIDDLESELASYDLWVANMRRIMVGDVDTTGESSLSAIAIPTDRDVTNISKVPEDQALRENLTALENPPGPTVINLSTQEKPLEQLFFTPPVSGEITYSFSPEKGHYGSDITAPKNTAVKSVMSGFVISSDWTLETGNTICIQHSDNLVSFYKHNSALLKKTGDIVKAGEAIAIIGNTGEHSTGPHLHFELWHKGKPIDPADYVNFY